MKPMLLLCALFGMFVFGTIVGLWIAYLIKRIK